VDYIQPAMSYSDEYDNVSDLAEVSLEYSGLGAYAGSGSISQERTVRRRSSKGASLNYTELIFHRYNDCTSL
jgi:hypothetical protein